MREAIRVHARSRARQDRGRRDDVEAFAQRGLVQPRHVESGIPSRLELRTQPPRIASRTREIQAWSLAPVDVADVFGNRLQLRQSGFAGLVGRKRMLLADELRKLQQLGIDFVLQQRGAGGGAAPADIAAIQHGRVQAGLDQRARNQCSGDARADHGNVAFTVGKQWRVIAQQAVAHGPPWVTAFHVHATSLAAMRRLAWRAIRERRVFRRAPHAGHRGVVGLRKKRSAQPTVIPSPAFEKTARRCVRPSSRRPRRCRPRAWNPTALQ